MMSKLERKPVAGLWQHGAPQGTWHVSVLHIEDDPEDAALIAQLLGEREGLPVRLTRVERLGDGLSHLAEEEFDLVLLDLDLPDSSGLDTVARTYRAAPNVPIVAVTANGDSSLATSILLAGAQDYISKHNMTKELLTRVVGYAIGRQAFQDSLRRSTLVDPATGLYTHDVFLALAGRDLKLAERRNDSVVFMAFYTGGLRRLGAAMGPEQEQRVAADFARMLRATFRETDLLGRVGPDSFAVLALDVTSEGRSVIAARVRRAMNTLTSHPELLGIKVGAVSPKTGVPVSAQQLLAEALADCTGRRMAVESDAEQSSEFLSLDS